MSMTTKERRFVGIAIMRIGLAKVAMREGAPWEAAVHMERAVQRLQELDPIVPGETERGDALVIAAAKVDAQAEGRREGPDNGDGNVLG